MNVFVEKGYNVAFVSKDIFIWQAYLEVYQRMGINIFYEHLQYKDYKYFISKYCANANYVWIYGPNSFKNYYEKIKSLFSNAKFIYDMVDIHHLRFKRASEINKEDKSNFKNYLAYKKNRTRSRKSI